MKIPDYVTRCTRNSIRVWLVFVGLLIIDPLPYLFIAGTIAVMLGALVRLWAKGCLNQNKTLTVAGPYRYARHPFYFGNLLMDAGILIIVNRWELALVYAPFWCAAHYTKIRSEELELERTFGTGYIMYKRHVPCLIPLPNNYSAPEGAAVPVDVPCEPATAREEKGFSWSNKNLRARNEIQRFLRALATPLFMFCVYDFTQDGWGFFYLKQGAGLFCFSALLFMLCLSLLINKPLIRGKAILPPLLSGSAAITAFMACFAPFLFLLNSPETDADAVMFTLGGTLSALFILCSFKITSPVHRDYAELQVSDLALKLFVCFIAAIMAELPWAGFISSLYFACLIFDKVIPQAADGHSEADMPGYARMIAAKNIALLFALNGMMIVKELLIP